jgi:hypothetical protein
MNLPIETDKNQTYMVNTRSMYLDTDEAIATIDNNTLCVECDQFFTNVFDSHHAKRPCGNICFVKNYSYSGSPNNTGGILNVPSWKNGMLNIRITKLDGTTATALDGHCDWVLTLLVYPVSVPPK